MKKVYLIAVVFALIAGFATYLFASQIQKNSSFKDADLVPVVMAVQDIPKNTIITQEMLAEDAGYFRLKNDVVKADATPAAISDVNKLLDQVAAVDIYAGEQMNEHKFVSPDSDDVGLSFKLAQNKVAYSFMASSTNGVDGYITPGDTVDIITYNTDPNGKANSKIAYSNLRVIRVSDASAQKADSKITSYSTITVEVSKKEALQLQEIEKSGSFKLILNSRRDEVNQQGQTEQTSQAEPTSAAAQN